MDFYFNLFGALKGGRVTGVLDLTDDLVSLTLYLSLTLLTSVIFAFESVTLEVVDVNPGFGIFSRDSVYFKYRFKAGLCSYGRVFLVILDLFLLRNCYSLSESINDLLIKGMNKHAITFKVDFAK